MTEMEPDRNMSSFLSSFLILGVEIMSADNQGWP